MQTHETTSAAPPSPPSGSDPNHGAGARLHLRIMAVVALLWVWSVAGADQADLGDFGIISILPFTAYLALGSALAGFVASLKAGAHSRLPGAYVAGVAVMIHGLPTFVLDHLRFSWAWKHVGIVEYIQRTGGVDPSIEALPVYHSWPAFFGLNAWITEAGQLESATRYAAWAPILFNLLFLGALYAIVRSFTSDLRLVWTSLMIFTLGNWVGQDYFAPQAMGFFLYLAAVAVALRWFGTTPETSRTGHGHGTPTEAGSTLSLVMSAVLMVMLLAITVSHQLTPVITLGAFIALRLFKIVRISWPIFALVVFNLFWMFGPARPFVTGAIGDIIAEFGGVQANLDDTLTDQSLFSPVQATVSLVARLLSLGVFALAGLGLLRRLHRRVPSRWSMLLAAVPASLMVVSSYGGEILFRAYMFGLPFAAFLAASLWFPEHGSESKAFGRAGLSWILIVLTAGVLVADFGLGGQVFSSDDLAAADFVFENAQPGALIVEGNRDYPRLYRNYEQFSYLGIDRSTPDTLQRLSADPAGRIALWLSDRERYNGGFVIITESQRKSVTALGTLLNPTLTGIEASLRASDQFEIVFESGDAVVFAPKGQQ